MINVIAVFLLLAARSAPAGGSPASEILEVYE
jgi:hypothetical protein